MNPILAGLRYVGPFWLVVVLALLMGWV